MTQALLARRAVLLGTGALALTSRDAGAQPAVDRLARIVVGAAPGGGTDTIARLLAEQLSGRYAPQVIVENRPGASSRLAAEAVKAAAPDGTTMLVCPLPVLALYPHVLPRTTRYDPLADFTPAATIGELAYGFTVPHNHPARDMPYFIEWGRSKGDVTFAPPVVGAPQHLLGLTFAQAAGLKLTVVTYRSASLAMQDLIAGRLDSYMSHMAEVSPQVRGGHARLLAVTSEGRLPSFADVPTFAERGFAQMTAGEAFVVMLPGRAPQPIVTALNAAVADAVASTTTRERLTQMQMTPMVLSPAETGARLAREFAAWGPVVRASGFTPEK